MALKPLQRKQRQGDAPKSTCENPNLIPLTWNRGKGNLPDDEDPWLDGNDGVAAMLNSTDEAHHLKPTGWE